MKWFGSGGNFPVKSGPPPEVALFDLVRPKIAVLFSEIFVSSPAQARHFSSAS